MPAATSRPGANDRLLAHDVRFFGAGVIGVAAIWTLLKIAGPVLRRHPLGLRGERARRGGARCWR